MFEEKRGIAYPRTLFFAIYFYFLFNQKKFNLLIYYVHVFLTHGKTATDDPFAISTYVSKYKYHIFYTEKEKPKRLVERCKAANLATHLSNLQLKFQPSNKWFRFESDLYARHAKMNSRISRFASTRQGDARTLSRD